MNATNPGATFNSAGVDPRIIEMPTSEIPGDMAFVPAGKYRLGAWGFDQETDLGSFLVDRTEVTNAEYFRFVEAGGYQNPKIWTPIIAASGAELAWQDIEQLFVDRTGVPGPAGWSFGSYAPGDRDFPCDRRQLVRGGRLPGLPRQILANLVVSLAPRNPRPHGVEIPVCNLPGAGE